MADEIVVSETRAGFLAPVVSVRDALLAYQAKKELIDGIFQGPTKENPAGIDYGMVPGSSKPTLLKAGAEKAASFFGLSARFKDGSVTEDWTGKDHDGEPFFYYRRTCELWRGNNLIASADGSCNSWEKKYRYRSSERVCPTCGKSTIIKGKAEFGGGWLCYAKKGGCGAQFSDTAPEIVNQEVGTIKNPDTADLVNTILKMADKRALVAATLIASGMSEYFTQDVDDFIVTGEIIPETPVPAKEKKSRKMTEADEVDAMFPPEPTPEPVREEAKPEPNGQRPYAPEQFKKAVEKLVVEIERKYTETGLELSASDDERKVVASIIDKIYGGDKGLSRHVVCDWLFPGQGSTKSMTPAQVKALFHVMGVKNEPEHRATFNDPPSGNSISEFRDAYQYVLAQQSK